MIFRPFGFVMIRELFTLLTTSLASKGRKLWLTGSGRLADWGC
jgi:hypothetical protein